MHCIAFSEKDIFSFLPLNRLVFHEKLWLRFLPEPRVSVRIPDADPLGILHMFGVSLDEFFVLVIAECAVLIIYDSAILVAS